MKYKSVAEAMLGNFSFPKILLRVMKIQKKMWEPTGRIKYCMFRKKIINWQRKQQVVSRVVTSKNNLNFLQ